MFNTTTGQVPNIDYNTKENNPFGKIKSVKTSLIINYPQLCPNIQSN